MKAHIVAFLSLFTYTAYPIQFKQVVIWGDKLHEHTNSYVYFAFNKAFKHLGYKTFWINSSDDVRSIDFSQTLFITEGQIDRNIPLRDDCWYILHNCDYTKYKELIEKKRCITLQVYTHDVLERNVQKVEPCIYYDVPGRVLYMPWATDLLPHEIDAIKHTIPTKKEPNAVFIGTIGSGRFGNIPELNQFQKACAQNKITFLHKYGINLDETISRTQKAYMAPSIQGSWQVEKGYIPCRIFKNISYGAWGITNSRTVWELFDKKITFNEDCYQLFYDAKEKLNTLTHQELFDLMDFVKEKHTYINRINHLLAFFDATQE